MSFVSHSARTVTVNNNDYSNSDSTATTGGAEANDDNINGPATSTAAVALRLASLAAIAGSEGVRPQQHRHRCGAAARVADERESLRGRGRHTASPFCRPMSQRRCPRSSECRGRDDPDRARLGPYRRREGRKASARAGTEAQFYAAETVERVSFYEMTNFSFIEIFMQTRKFSCKHKILIETRNVHSYTRYRARLGRGLVDAKISTEVAAPLQQQRRPGFKIGRLSPRGLGRRSMVFSFTGGPLTRIRAKKWSEFAEIPAIQGVDRSEA